MHKAGKKYFAGKGYKWYVVHNGYAVAGFPDEESANIDCNDRNSRAKKMDINPGYTVEPASEAEIVDTDEK